MTTKFSFAANILSTLMGAVIVLCCYFSGQWFASCFALPVPGTLCGLLMLFLILTFKPQVKPAISKAIAPLLLHMPVLFVPATIGVVHYWPQLKNNALAVGIALGATTLLSLGVMGIVVQYLLKKRKSSSITAGSKNND